jgi:hypothetical protein
MDDLHLFKSLATEEPSLLLDLLRKAYYHMDHDQRWTVFGKYVETLPPAPVDGEALLNQIELFQRRSLAGVYYAPFDVNSKNWMDVPEETNDWFEEMSDLLKACCQLTAQEDHLHAVACFGILYELLEALDSGEEIVFGDEVGSWMITADKKQYTLAYLTSLAAIATPEEFTTAALLVIRRDSWQSFMAQAYPAAISVANEAQREYLEAEIQRQKIRTERK